MCKRIYTACVVALKVRWVLGLVNLLNFCETAEHLPIVDIS